VGRDSDCFLNHLTFQGQTLRILTNIDNKNNQKVEVSLKGYKVGNVTGRILTSSKVQDHNTFDNPSKVAPKSFNKTTFSGDNLIVNMPPNSVVVLKLNKQ